MGSKAAKTNTMISFVDPITALKGQPFVQPSDQKKPSVPLVEEPEPLVYNLFNFIEKTPGPFQSLFPSPFLNSFNGPLNPTLINAFSNCLIQNQFPLAIPYNGYSTNNFTSNFKPPFLNNIPLAMPFS